MRVIYLSWGLVPCVISAAVLSLVPIGVKPTVFLLGAALVGFWSVLFYLAKQAFADHPIFIDEDLGLMAWGLTTTVLLDSGALLALTLIGGVWELNGFFPMLALSHWVFCCGIITLNLLDWKND